MRYLKHLWKLALLSSLCISLAACSDDSVSSSEEEEQNPQEKPSDETPEDPGEHTNAYNVILVPVMADSLEVAQGGAVSLKVMLVSVANDDTLGNGVPDQMIRWSIKSGNDNASLKRAQSFTNEGGLAEVVVEAGHSMGDVIVEASYDNAPKPVQFTVTVGDIPTGSLKARINYTGKAPVKDYSLRLYDRNSVNCDNFDPAFVPDVDPLFSQNAVYAFIKDLSVEGSYTLIGYGYSEMGAIIAGGCTTSNLKIQADTTSEATVSLQAIDLDMSTTYHVRSYFDLGDVTSALGTVGNWSTMIGNFADNPAGMLYDILFDVIKSNLGGVAGVVGSVVEKVLSWTGLEDELLDYLNGLITQSKVGCQTGLFVCQFRDVIRLMEFMGELNVQRKGSVELAGANTYNGLALYWRMGCLNSDDPNCGRLPLTTKQLDLGTSVNFLEGSWQGSVANGYDKLSIEAHELNLYYGKIMVYALNNILIPKITSNNAHSFAEALAYWLNADAIAQWISDTLTIDWLGVTVTKSQARGWVDKAISGLSALIGFGEAYLSMQKAGSEITLSGIAFAKDTNGDNLVDDIVDGEWSGSMLITTSDKDENGNEISTSTTTGVRGIWSAYNLKNVKISEDGIYCTYPKTETDSVDQLCSYPAIDKNKLVSSYMCAKYASCAQ